MINLVKTSVVVAFGFPGNSIVAVVIFLPPPRGGDDGARAAFDAHPVGMSVERQHFFIDGAAIKTKGDALASPICLVGENVEIFFEDIGLVVFEIAVVVIDLRRGGSDRDVG